MSNKKRYNDSYEQEDEIDLLTDEELEMLRATRPTLDRSTLPPHDNSDLAKAKRFAKNNKLITVIVAVTISLLVLLLLVAGAFAAYKLLTAPSTDDYEIILGVGDSSKSFTKKDKITVPYKSATFDGEFYIDMIYLRDFVKLESSFTGTDEIFAKFTAPDGTFVRFTNGEKTAFIGDTTGTPDYYMLGGTAKITAPTKNKQGSCLVPFTFVKKLFGKDSLMFIRSENEIQICHRQYKNSEQLYPISFSSSEMTPADNVMLAKYKQLYPDAPSALFEKELLLVNKSHPLGATYAPEDLVLLTELNCPVSWNEESKLVRPAAIMTAKMMEDLNAYLQEKKATTVEVTSAYRDYATQEKLYNRYIEEAKGNNPSLSHEECVALVNATSAQAGESEHQSGLCIDIIEKGDEYLDEEFENTEAFDWLSKNAYRYGFIIRYPKDKTEITKYSYEPWHYRFVGIDAATVIHTDAICLEEYLVQTKE